MKCKNLQTRVNPIQQARLQLVSPDGSPVTQAKLAAVAGVSKPLIMRIEQGLISNVSYPVLNALYSNSLEQARALDAFDEWRKETRSKNMVYFINRVENGFRGSWLALRESIHESQVGFCKLYCIHPQVLRNFEKPKVVSKRRELSAYLKDVFSSAGIENVKKLEEGMRYYSDTRAIEEEQNHKTFYSYGEVG